MYKLEGCLQSTPSAPSVQHTSGKATTGSTLCAVPVSEIQDGHELN